MRRSFVCVFGKSLTSYTLCFVARFFNTVSTQRRQYRMVTNGAHKTVPLTRDRAQMLIDIGFEWSAKDPTHRSWDFRFDELIAFKRRFGNTLVPMGWKENPRLATWVSTQVSEMMERKGVGPSVLSWKGYLAHRLLTTLLSNVCSAKSTSSYKTVILHDSITRRWKSWIRLALCGKLNEGDASSPIPWQ